jgi:hypothetical protein
VDSHRTKSVARVPFPISGDKPTVARPTLAANQMNYLCRVLAAQHDEDAMAKKTAKKKTKAKAKAKGKGKKK